MVRVVTAFPFEGAVRVREDSIGARIFGIGSDAKELKKLTPTRM